MADLETEVDLPDEFEAFDNADDDASGPDADKNESEGASGLKTDDAQGEAAGAARPSTDSQRRTRDRRETISADEVTSLMDQTSLQPSQSDNDNDPVNITNTDTEGRTQPVPIAPRRAPSTPSQNLSARSATPTSHTAFTLTGVSGGGLGPVGEQSILDNGPMTPRNDAGPFVLDGSAGRDRRAEGIGAVEDVLNGGGMEHASSLDAEGMDDAQLE